MCTWQELETYWSMSDYLDALDYLDFKEDVEAYHHEKSKSKTGK
jgi:hypothetical protein